MVIDLKTLYGAEATSSRSVMRSFPLTLRRSSGMLMRFHISVRRAEPRWAATTPTTTTARCWRRL